MTSRTLNLVSALALATTLTVPAFAANSAAESTAQTITAGVGPLIDDAGDLVRKDADINSWFVTGHFTAEGHKLNYLYHIMIIPGPDNQPMIQSDVSLTDETTGWHQGDDVIIPLSAAKVGKAVVDYTLPNGGMIGSLDGLHLQATLPDGAVDIQMHATSPTLLNGGTGIFPLVGMVIHEYSIPRLASVGTITIKGKTYSVTGDSWFDRQWQDYPATPTTLKWSWMGISLDNGDVVSLWSAFDGKIGANRAWATIMHADGAQTTTPINPDLGATDVWTSAASGNSYPTKWTVRIPEVNAELKVTPSPREQEIISKAPELNKYEGASAIEGIWGGKPVTGFGYVELVGAWK